MVGTDFWICLVSRTAVLELLLLVALWDLSIMILDVRQGWLKTNMLIVYAVFLGSRLKIQFAC